jgi:hypothetical protein
VYEVDTYIKHEGPLLDLFCKPGVDGEPGMQPFGLTVVVKPEDDEDISPAAKSLLAATSQMFARHMRLMADKAYNAGYKAGLVAVAAESEASTEES